MEGLGIRNPWIEANGLEVDWTTLRAEMKKGLK
jgi:hypothetical protein